MLTPAQIADLPPKEQFKALCLLYPGAAHELAFAPRRQDASPLFHEEMITRWHSPNPKDLFIVFRGGAKSTITEEGVILDALMEMFHYCVFISSNEKRAMDRLIAVRHELERNERLRPIFGDPTGDKWTDSELILRSGVKLQALGQGQDVRGLKHLSWRPDLVIIDDLERRDDALTPEARERMLRWFLGEFVPAADPRARYRVNGTPLEDSSLVVELSKLSGWRSFTVPIKTIDPVSGEWKSTWEDRFPLEHIDEIEAEYTALGQYDLFQREFMCEAVAAQTRLFKPEYFIYEAHVPGHEAVTAIYDPARTVKKTSAHTGKVVVSWRRHKLFIWESGGYFWTPSEIVDDMFDVDRRFSPLYIGVERDGLEEFILQPLRHEGVRRRQPLTVKELRAPRGKMDFIKGLQPFFKAKEVVLVGGPAEHKTLVDQLTAFPSGRVDAPNALAYVISNRPGAPVYDGFTDENIQDLYPIPRVPWLLGVQAEPGRLAAVLVQAHNSRIYIHADWIMEAEPAVALADAIASARLITAGRTPDVFAPPEHFGAFDRIGLRPAARSIPLTLYPGASPVKGRPAVAAAIRERRQHEPMLLVSPSAHWCIKAFVGGYARALSHDGSPGEPERNHYALVMEALESLTGTATARSLNDEEQPRYATTPDGRRYMTTLG